MDNADNTVLEASKDDDTENKIKHDIEVLLTEIIYQEEPPIRDQHISSKKRYVLGFALTPDKKSVLLIAKNRPENQAGLLNGIGGKVESFDQTEHMAMEREFTEETGLNIPANHWKLFSIMDGQYFKVSVFWTISDQLMNYKSITDEVVSLEYIDDLYNLRFNNCVHNLSWIISMLQDPDLNKIISHITYE